MLHHYWINYTGFQQLKELNIKFLACAMTQSEKLSRLTCLIYFNGTPHPVYCVPLLIPAVFGFQKKRKRFKGGYSSFPIWTLSNGINSPTLCYYILPCIQYKILLTFKSLANQAPSYLSDLIQLYVPSRQLRSSANTRLFRLQSTHLRSCGQRASFS